MRLKETRMTRLSWGGLCLGVTLTACSSNPYNPINQSGLIRAMDRWFSGGETDRYTPPLGYHPQRQPEVWVRASAPPTPPNPAVRVSATP
jgi:hypothetical protein